MFPPNFSVSSHYSHESIALFLGFQADQLYTLHTHVKLVKSAYHEKEDVVGKSVVTDTYLTYESAARAHLEAIRWPDGPICPHCSATKIYRLKVKNTQREVLKCATCRKQFSVTVGTIFEDSHIPLTKWIQAMQLLCSSKKGMSTHQLHRMLEITYKSAWFMSHRIRHAMSQSVFADKLGGTVEIDEIYVGSKRRRVKRGSKSHRTPVVSLVERTGRVRSFVLPLVNAKNLTHLIRANVEPTTKVMTDSCTAYKGLDKEFASHQTVNHMQREYATRRGSSYEHGGRLLQLL